MVKLRIASDNSDPAQSIEIEIVQEIQQGKYNPHRPSLSSAKIRVQPKPAGKTAGPRGTLPQA
jgi:hypothetical protein